MSMAIIGVDEVGRGPLAGPVVTCAVRWPSACVLPGLTDSKQMSARRREALVPAIESAAIEIAYGRAEVDEIDALNILQATLLAMTRAVAALGAIDCPILIDGNRIPIDLVGRAEAVIGGDAVVPAISAASVLAKVARDREMVVLDGQYPGYGFAQHAGYPTRTHLEALTRLGASPIHRRSFAPVARLLESTCR